MDINVRRKSLYLLDLTDMNLTVPSHLRHGQTAYKHPLSQGRLRSAYHPTIPNLLQKPYQSVCPHISSNTSTVQAPPKKLAQHFGFPNLRVRGTKVLSKDEVLSKDTRICKEKELSKDIEQRY